MFYTARAMVLITLDKPGWSGGPIRRDEERVRCVKIEAGDMKSNQTLGRGLNMIGAISNSPIIWQPLSDGNDGG